MIAVTVFQILSLNHPGYTGKTDDERKVNLAGIIDGYFAKKAHHINVNVLNRETPMDAHENPEKYP